MTAALDVERASSSQPPQASFDITTYSIVVSEIIPEHYTGPGLLEHTTRISAALGSWIVSLNLDIITTAIEDG